MNRARVRDIALSDTLPLNPPYLRKQVIMYAIADRETAMSDR